MLTFFASLVLSLIPAQVPSPQYDWDLDGRITTADLTAYDACLAGAPLPSPAHTIDINANTVFPEDADRDTLISVLTGGPDNTGFIPPLCPSCPVLTADVPDSPPASFTLDLGAILARLPRETYAGVTGTPGIILIPWRPTPYTLLSPILDNGGTPGRPLVLLGVPGPDGQRPQLLLSGAQSVGIHLSGSTSHLVVDSLHLVGTPAHSAVIRAFGPAHNILIQDCILEGGAIGIAVEGLTMPGVGTFISHRNIYLRQASSLQHNQGNYVSACQLFTCTESVFYETGLPTTFNQGNYFVAGAGYRTLARSFIYRAAFSGIQARGGTYLITDNIFESCGNAIGIGHPMSYGNITTGEFSNNLILYPKAPAWGIAVQNSSATISNNTLISAPGVGYAIQVDNPNPLPTTITATSVSGFERIISYRQDPSLSPGLSIEEPRHVTQAPPTIPWSRLISRPARHWSPLYSTSSYLPVPTPTPSSPHP